MKKTKKILTDLTIAASLNLLKRELKEELPCALHELGGDDFFISDMAWENLNLTTRKALIRIIKILLTNYET